MGRLCLTGFGNSASPPRSWVTVTVSALPLPPRPSDGTCARQSAPAFMPHRAAPLPAGPVGIPPGSAGGLRIVVEDLIANGLSLRARVSQVFSHLYTAWHILRSRTSGYEPAASYCVYPCWRQSRQPYLTLCATTSLYNPIPLDNLKGQHDRFISTTNFEQTVQFDSISSKKQPVDNDCPLSCKSTITHPANVIQQSRAVWCF